MHEYRGLKDQVLASQNTFFKKVQKGSKHFESFKTASAKNPKTTDL